MLQDQNIGLSAILGVLVGILSIVSVISVLLICTKATFSRGINTIHQNTTRLWGLCCNRSYLTGVSVDNRNNQPGQVVPNLSDTIIFEPIPGFLSTSSLATRNVADFERKDLSFCDSLGRGWFGWVVLGRLRDRGTVVVKILKDDASSEQVTQFSSECDMFVGVDHPNVMVVLGRCFDMFPLLAVLEDVAYKSVKSFLLQCQTDQDVELALRLARDASCGLSALHAKNLVPHDLSARTCILTDNMILKVADYGLGRSLHPDDYCKIDLHGSVEAHPVPLRWMSPRQLKQSKQYTSPMMEDNLWTLGILIWEITAFGRLPYGPLSNMEVLVKLSRNEDVTPFFQTLFASGLKARCVMAVVLLSLASSPELRPTASKMENYLKQITIANSQQHLANLYQRLQYLSRGVENNPFYDVLI